MPVVVDPEPKGTACKTCGSTTRAVRRPGPRCATCARATRRTQRTQRHGNHVLRDFGLTVDQYWGIYAAQGGRCALCRVANGRARRLAVDHDHACCPSVPTCGRCVRGLLCSVCNQWLGHVRDAVGFGYRFVDYLTTPPATAVLAAAGIEPYRRDITPALPIETPTGIDRDHYGGQEQTHPTPLTMPPVFTHSHPGAQVPASGLATPPLFVPSTSTDAQIG
jgi:Recombination endonuclease VII